MSMKAKSTIVYCKGSDTIRQAPENYLIAKRDVGINCWVCDPDLASDTSLATAVFFTLLKYSYKYGKAEDIVKCANKISSSMIFKTANRMALLIRK